MGWGEPRPPVAPEHPSSLAARLALVAAARRYLAHDTTGNREAMAEALAYYDKQPVLG